MQRVAQLAELVVDERADPPSVMAAQEIRPTSLIRSGVARDDPPNFRTFIGTNSLLERLEARGQGWQG